MKANETRRDRLHRLANQETRPLAKADPTDLPDRFWKEARLWKAPAKETISLRVDADILAFFRKDGAGYQTRINQVLKTYVEAVRA